MKTASALKILRTIVEDVEDQEVGKKLEAMLKCLENEFVFNLPPMEEDEIRLFPGNVVECCAVYSKRTGTDIFFAHRKLAQTLSGKRGRE